MITISVKLPEVTEAHLTAAAKRRGRSKSALIREALDAHLRRGRSCERRSCLDLARDLAGCVRGPADLATHRRHLRGYGQ